MLQINVSQQLKSSIGSTRDYDVNGIIEMDGYDSTVRGEVQLMHTDRSILVKGEINAASEINCGRCLSPFKEEVTLHIEEEYFPSSDIINGTLLPEPDEPGVFTIDENGIMDLTEAIRQYTVLVSPMKPLCSEDCAGLCPVCGTNLNQASCGCTRQPADGPWAKLSELAMIPTETSVPRQKGTK
ncbi:MAG: DUF177 domain-containing protein [Dehalococcoidales bacterium]